jgi:hypothetical protein
VAVSSLRRNLKAQSVGRVRCNRAMGFCRRGWADCTDWEPARPGIALAAAAAAACALGGKMAGNYLSS